MRGALLVESLVALLVVSVGLLGLMALLLQALALASAGFQQQRALWLAADLGEWLRLVPAAVAAAGPGAGPGVRDCEGAERCTPEELLDAGHRRWQARIRRELPDAVGDYRVVELGEAQAARISLRWNHPRLGPRSLVADHPLRAEAPP